MPREVKLKDTLKYIAENPGKTATQIARTMGLSPASVSSFLHAALLEGKVLREPKKGPRGGFGYMLPEKRVRRPSAWKRLAAGVEL